MTPAASCTSRNMDSASVGFGRIDEHGNTNRVMATLQQTIADKFLAKLSEGKATDAEKIEQLRTLLAGSKKPKAEDFVKIFTMPAGGDVK
jgi:hypothetical protein